jgi:hypothetical protein
MDDLKRNGMISMIVVFVLGGAILRSLLPPLSFWFLMYLLPH